MDAFSKEIFVRLVKCANAWCYCARSKRMKERDVFTVDFLEHRKHVLQVVVVKKPNLRILVILFKRDSKAVGDIHNTRISLQI
jgi:hypothetical protein